MQDSKYVKLSSLHFTAKKLALKKARESLVPLPVSKVIDIYYTEFWKLLRQLMAKGYGLKAKNLFTIKVKDITYRVKKGNKHFESDTVKAYIKLSDSFKQIVKKGKNNFEIEIIDRESGKRIKL